mgnify:CR=1 FL=1
MGVHRVRSLRHRPVVVGAEVGDFLIRYGRTYSSIFGPAEGVLGIWSRLQFGPQRPHDVRPNQPLLVLDGVTKSFGAVAALRGATVAIEGDEQLLDLGA